jgi:hypothetical protein
VLLTLLAPLRASIGKCSGRIYCTFEVSPYLMRRERHLALLADLITLGMEHLAKSPAEGASNRVFLTE